MGLEANLNGGKPSKLFCMYLEYTLGMVYAYAP